MIDVRTANLLVIASASSATSYLHQKYINYLSLISCSLLSIAKIHCKVNCKRTLRYFFISLVHSSRICIYYLLLCIKKRSKQSSRFLVEFLKRFNAYHRVKSDENTKYKTFFCWTILIDKITSKELINYL